MVGDINHVQGILNFAFAEGRWWFDWGGGGVWGPFCQVSVTRCGIFSPGKIGGDVDEAKLLLLVPEENCNNHFVCPKEHREVTMSFC